MRQSRDDIVPKLLTEKVIVSVFFEVTNKPPTLVSPPSGNARARARHSAPMTSMTLASTEVLENNLVWLRYRLQLLMRSGGRQ